jgi:hypothetical protein
MQLAHQKDDSTSAVLLHTRQHSIAAVPAGSGCMVYILAAGNSFSIEHMQELVHRCVPGVVLGDPQ